jgi:hypothetical protein
VTAGLLEDDFADLDPKTDKVSDGPLSTSRSNPATRSGTTRRRVGKGKLDLLQKKLSTELFTIGTMSGLAFPTTGYYICQESDAFTRAVVELGSKRPEWIEALEHIADIQPGIVVGRTCLGVGVAFAVDRQRVDPETNRFAMLLGVRNAWEAVQSQRPPGIEEGNAYSPPPAPSFQAVA